MAKVLAAREEICREICSGCGERMKVENVRYWTKSVDYQRPCLGEVVKHTITNAREYCGALTVIGYGEPLVEGPAKDMLTFGNRIFRGCPDD